MDRSSGKGDDDEMKSRYGTGQSGVVLLCLLQCYRLDIWGTYTVGETDREKGGQEGT